MNKEAIIAKIRQYPIAVGGAILAIVLAVLIYVRSGHLVDLGAEHEALDSQWRAANRNETRAVDLETHVGKVNEIVEEVGRRLMKPEERALNYRYFYGLEKACGIRITNLVQKKQEVNDGKKKKKKKSMEPELEYYRPVKYELAANGSFQQSLQFLAFLEEGKFFTRIDTVIFNRDNKLNPGLVEMQLKLGVLGIK